MEDTKGGMPADKFAKQMVDALLLSKPPAVWRSGDMAWAYWPASFLPAWLFDGLQAKLMGVPSTLPVAENTEGAKKVD